MSKQLMTPAEIERATVERCASLADSLYAEARADEITQAIRAIPPMFGDVPAGWKLVPVEPTGEMLGALTNVAARCNSWKEGYKAMLAAAPTAGQAAAKGAQKPSLPFALLDEELSDLMRFHECAMDNEGYDVPKDRMKNLAEIGLVRRVSANYYEATTFGLAVINGEFSMAAAPEVK